MAETLDDLLRKKKVGRLDKFAEKAGIGAKTLFNLRNGDGEPRHGTVLAIAVELGVSVERVKKAIAATQAERKKG